MTASSKIKSSPKPVVNFVSNLESAKIIKGFSFKKY